MSDFTGLAIAGRIAGPNDSDWDEARAAWNLVADQRPTAVVFAESANDIAATVRFAAERGLRVAGQGTGHGAVALGPLIATGPRACRRRSLRSSASCNRPRCRTRPSRCATGRC
jgi:hypothetical protein